MWCWDYGEPGAEMPVLMLCFSFSKKNHPAIFLLARFYFPPRWTKPRGACLTATQATGGNPPKKIGWESVPKSLLFSELPPGASFLLQLFHDSHLAETRPGYKHCNLILRSSDLENAGPEFGVGEHDSEESVSESAVEPMLAAALAHRHWAEVLQGCSCTSWTG